MRRWLYFENTLALLDPSSLINDLSWGVEWRTGRDVRYDIKSQSNILTSVGTPTLSSGGLLDSNALSPLSISNHLVYNPASSTDPRSNFKITHTIAILFQCRPQINGTYEASFLLSKDQFSSSQRDYLFFIESQAGGLSSPILAQIQSGTARGGILNNNQWYLLIGEYNQSSNIFSLTINNQFIASGGGGAFSSSNLNIPLFVGVRRVTSNNDFDPPSYATFNHRLQYMYKWNRLLTQAEKDYLYNNGNFIFLT